MRSFYVAALICASVTVSVSNADAQQLGYEQSLRTLIPALQHCGPPQAYQILGPQIFNLISAQTGGMGCFQQLQPLGGISDIEELSSVDLPAGPVKTMKVTHSNGMETYWQIGISQFTNKVEFLNFNFVRPQDLPQEAPAVLPYPSVAGGDAQRPLPSRVEERRRRERGEKKDDSDRERQWQEACLVYPAMCQR